MSSSVADTRPQDRATAYHQEVLYHLVAAAEAVRLRPTSRDVHELYDTLAPLLYRGTVHDPLAGERSRRTHLNALVDAGRLAFTEAGPEYVWRVADRDP